MRFETPSTTARCLLAAGLVLGAAAAQAAGGYTITHAQERGIALGASAGEVRQALGRPARIERFASEPGPVWTYTVSGAAEPMATFEIGFDADGKVASVLETETLVE